MKRFIAIIGLLELALLACSSTGGESADGALDLGPTEIEADATGGDVSTSPAYPDGPYGMAVGETIAKLEFYNQKTEETASLAQWYQHPKVKLLMLVSTAAW